MKKTLYKILYVQVLAAIVIGVLLGFFLPRYRRIHETARGTVFIKLIKNAHRSGDFSALSSLESREWKT